MKVIAIIPARMNSSRFPGKPMTKIHGIPMIGHCFYRIKMCKDLLEVYVATCDDEIVNYIESIGGNAIMTSTSHKRATDRTAEAMIKIEEMTGGNIDVVVMVQGDEPMITPEMITDAIQPFDNADTINVVNLMANIKSVEEFEDPNEVKVVVDNETWSTLNDSERSRITKYDYEFKINERNRQIKIIDKQYIEGIFKEAQSKRYGT